MCPPTSWQILLHLFRIIQERNIDYHWALFMGQDDERLSRLVFYLELIPSQSLILPDAKRVLYSEAFGSETTGGSS